MRARTTAAEAERFPIAMATRGKEDTCRLRLELYGIDTE